jgi:hypothetical protein
MAPSMPDLRADVHADGPATDYARRLLADLDSHPDAGRLRADLDSDPDAGRALPVSKDPHPALAWARSGAMALCGDARALPRVGGALATAADGVGRALAALGARAPADAAALLGERAALLGLARRGRVSPGGSCRLLRAADGWAALNLSRDDDRRALPAWLDARADADDPWDFAARELRRRPLAALAERAAWLGLPFAPAAPPPRAPGPWLRVAAEGPRAPRPRRPPRVLDLSSLWAGPLCAALLADAGADVIKLESRARPDGARAGHAGFFALLNARKRSVALDLGAARDRALLDALLDAADVVIESSRPRALAQLGVDAEAFVAARPGRLWLSLTGYGRDDPPPGRVAFGDDAAVAAGLAHAVADADGPLFCGDAIADPLAGLHAALALWAYWRRGRGALLDVALRDVAAHAFAAAPVEGFAVEGEPEAAIVRVGACAERVAAPRARRPARPARALGADTDALRRELGAC